MYSYVPQDADQAKPNEGGKCFSYGVRFFNKRDHAR